MLTHCDCGAELKTLYERRDGLCAECGDIEDDHINAEARARYAREAAEQRRRAQSGEPPSPEGQAGEPPQ